MIEKTVYKIGLVLGGGGSRGFTHLGVAKALLEKGIMPDVISSVSAGSIAGALLADGHHPDEILNILSSRSFFSFTRFSFSNKGMLNLNGLRKKIGKLLTTDRIEHLKTKLFIAVTNLNTGLIEYRDTGPLVNLICASSGIPVMFKPIEIEGNLYVDGGLIDNLPIFPIRNCTEKLIIVNLIPIKVHTKFKGSKSLYKKMADIAVYHHVKAPVDQNDILIEPAELIHYPYFSNKKAKELFEIGYNTTKLMEINF
jgi:NTE family protein